MARAATKKPSKRSAARELLMKSVARRLLLVREVLGLKQGEFGRRAGLKPNAYNMIESGDRLPSIEVAIRICDAHRLTLDFIFRGDAGDLPHNIASAIEALSEARTTLRD